MHARAELSGEGLPRARPPLLLSDRPYRQRDALRSRDFYPGTPGSGVLYLGINDNSVAANTGSWTVNIKLGGLPPQA